MANEFEEFNRLLQEEMKKSYSEKAIGYFNSPANMGPIEDADGFAEISDSHGDQLYLWIKVEDQTIKKATFFTSGCITIRIAASGLTELVTGKTLDEAMAVKPKTLREFIGKTPRQTWHCTNLAVEALQTAVRNWAIMSVFKNPNNKTIQINL